MGKYSSDVNYKFTENCEFMEFYGATIISPIAPQERIYQELAQISRRAQQSSYRNKRAFMPEASFHMTNFVLYNDHPLDRNSSGWSKKVPKDISFQEMNRWLYHALQKVRFPEYYTMKVEGVYPPKLQVVPADNRTRDEMRRFRDEVSEATGIRWDDHEEYQFHISYAYALIELSESEQEEQRALLDVQTAHLKKVIPEFRISKGVFCTFKDMSHFEPYVIKKENMEV